MLELIEAASDGYMDIVRFHLATEKCDVNHQDDFGNTALALAASRCSPGIVRLLLATGKCDVNRANKNGFTALALAASKGSTGIVRLLLATGKCDVNHSSKTGETAFILAARYGRMNVLRSLLATEECDFNHTNEKGETGLSLALRNGDTDIARLIKWWMVKGELDRRRSIQTKVICHWASITDFEKPGSNVFFYNMGQGLQTPCTLEDLREILPQANNENHRFFIDGCFATL